MDVLAETIEDLMYLSGERIIVLKHIEDDFYLGYCEGVIGRFNAENVHFVELDPRVLNSLDADIDIESLGVRFSTDQGERQHYSFNGAWIGRSSMDSLITTSTTSGTSYRHDIDNPKNYGQRVYRSSYLKTSAIQEPQENFDTSGFNEDYSEEEEDDDDDDDITSSNEIIQQYATNNNNHINNNNNNTSYQRATSPVSLNSKNKPIPLTSTMNHSQINNKSQTNYTSDDDDGDDEDNGDNFGNDSGISSKNSSKPSVDPYSTPNSDPSIDENGFIISKADLEKRQRSMNRSSITTKSLKHYREREVKWLSIVGKMDAGSVKKDAKLKKLVRSGIPTSVRAKVWQFLSGSTDYQKKGQFKALLQKPPMPIYNVIDRDIPRCYPDHTLFKDENSQGQIDLDMILKAYAQYNPKLEYCQGMGRLAGLMLMHMPTEDAFWLFVCTIDRYMNGYFTPDLSQLRIDAYIIGQLLKDHEPKLAQHLENNDVIPIMYIPQWFLTAFTVTLPWNSVLRVWDVFYFEGVKVFYRISLAILQICKDYLLQSCPSNSEILYFLLHIPHDYLSADVLLDTAFKIKLSKTDISRYAKKATTLNGNDTQGLPFEHGLKNLSVGTTSSNSIGNFKDKIKKKSSSLNIRDQPSN
ncbi:unnamed protein product [Cunninghamella echinulata]